MRKSIVSLCFMAALTQAETSGFGLGLFVSNHGGGVSAKTYLSGQDALQLGLSFWNERYYYKGDTRYYDNRDHTQWRVQVNYLKHYPNVIKPKKGKMPLYFGIGGFFQTDSDWSDFGLRMPLGLAYELPKGVPLDFFLEVTPELHMAGGTQVDVDPALGVRFWF